MLKSRRAQNSLSRLRSRAMICLSGMSLRKAGANPMARSHFLLARAVETSSCRVTFLLKRLVLEILLPNCMVYHILSELDVATLIQAWIKHNLRPVGHK